MEAERSTGRAPVTLEDFWSLQNVADPQVSPDGKTVAYVIATYEEAKNQQHSAIWLVDIETGATRQLTSGETSDSQPRWSPDGSRLAFVSARHEGKPQVFVIPVDGGEARRVTTLENGAASPVWAPDGTRLCVTSEVEVDRLKVPQEVAWFEAHQEADQKAPRMKLERSLLWRFNARGYIERRPQLFLVDLEHAGAEPKQLTEGDVDNLMPAWSPDGSLITFTSNRTEHSEFNLVSDVWVLDVETGEQRVLTDGTLSAYSPAWSPDGSSIAFYAMPDMVTHGFRFSEVWVVSRDGGDQRSLTASLDQSCGGGVQPDYEWAGFNPPAWSPDGSTIYFIANEGGDGAVYAVNVAGDDMRRVSRSPADAVSVAVAQSGTLLICLAATPDHPYDVFAVAAGGGELRPITNSNPEITDRRLLSAPERITFKGADGWEIEGWLYPPVGSAATKPYPLVLHVHGGPFGAWGNTFYFQAQALAGKGYGSLYLNPRGSTGYGYTFARAADWGQKDYEDLMAGVDAVVERGAADPSRLAIIGISYGGFMTNWALGHTDRFKAGVSVNGVANFLSMYGLSDMTSLWFELEMGGPFWASEENWQRYRFHSPITYVGNITTPMLFLQSENDFRCPIEEGEQMLTSLRMRRQTVELVRIPGASHVIVMDGTPHQRYFQWKLALDWFDRYVTGKAEAPAEEEEAGVAAATVSVE